MRITRMLLLLPLCACGGETEAVDVELTPAVYTTFHPTTWMAERIAGGLVDVVCPVPEGEDPIFWQPDRETLQAYQRAALIVVNGAEFEKWVDGASLPTSRVVDTASGFEDRWIEYEDATVHSHGPAGEHTHAGIDGHTWLDPLLAKEQAAAIRDGMVKAFPEHADAFASGFAGLAEQLDALHEALEALSPRVDGAKLLASHPAYNYLARRYGWEIRNFDLDPEAQLAPSDVDELREAAEEGEIVVLLWESEPVVAGRQVPKGLRSVVFSPGEMVETGEDFLGVMERNVASLSEAVGE